MFLRHSVCIVHPRIKVKCEGKFLTQNGTGINIIVCHHIRRIIFVNMHKNFLAGLCLLRPGRYKMAHEFAMQFLWHGGQGDDAILCDARVKAACDLNGAICQGQKGEAGTQEVNCTQAMEIAQGCALCHTGIKRDMPALSSDMAGMDASGNDLGTGHDHGLCGCAHDRSTFLCAPARPGALFDCRPVNLPVQQGSAVCCVQHCGEGSRIARKFPAGGLRLRCIVLISRRCLKACRAGLFAGEKIALQRLRQRCIRVIAKRIAIGGGASVKGACHFLDSLSNANIGSTHLAQVLFHILKEEIKQVLGGLARAAPGLQRLADEYHMQHNHIKAAIKAVANAKTGVKNRLAGLPDNGAIKCGAGVLTARKQLRERLHKGVCAACPGRGGEWVRV